MPVRQTATAAAFDLLSCQPAGAMCLVLVVRVAAQTKHAVADQADQADGRACFRVRARLCARLDSQEPNPPFTSLVVISPLQLPTMISHYLRRKYLPGIYPVSTRYLLSAEDPHRAFQSAHWGRASTSPPARPRRADWACVKLSNIDQNIICDGFTTQSSVARSRPDTRRDAHQVPGRRVVRLGALSPWWSCGKYCSVWHLPIRLS